ncbi:MAG: monovalent cation/H(+) antiporter subunit G [Paracoccus sp. (in: a-proteobacteria)]|nr:monovalent cation/H(+) antiporter subunit G [Paracoccus sp. (in: a-proteobacteria)]
MSGLDALPPVVAILIAILLVIGATLTLLGNLGLVRFRNFYQRLHAPTLGASWGTGAIVLSSIIVFSVIEGQPALREGAIGVLIMATTPIALLLLGRAARRRDPTPPSGMIKTAGTDGNPDIAKSARSPDKDDAGQPEDHGWPTDDARDNRDGDSSDKDSGDADSTAATGQTPDPARAG